MSMYVKVSIGNGIVAHLETVRIDNFDQALPASTYEVSVTEFPKGQHEPIRWEGEVIHVEAQGALVLLELALREYHKHRAQEAT